MRSFMIFYQQQDPDNDTVQLTASGFHVSVLGLSLASYLLTAISEYRPTARGFQPTGVANLVRVRVRGHDGGLPYQAAEVLYAMVQACTQGAPLFQQLEYRRIIAESLERFESWERDWLVAADQELPANQRRQPRHWSDLNEEFLQPITHPAETR